MGVAGSYVTHTSSLWTRDPSTTDMCFASLFYLPATQLWLSSAIVAGSIRGATGMVPDHAEHLSVLEVNLMAACESTHRSGGSGDAQKPLCAAHEAAKEQR